MKKIWIILLSFHLVVYSLLPMVVQAQDYGSDQDCGDDYYWNGSNCVPSYSDYDYGWGDYGWNDSSTSDASTTSADDSQEYTPPAPACTPKSCDDFTSDEANTCSSGDNSTLFEPDGCGGTLTCQGTMDCSSPVPQSASCSYDCSQLGEGYSGNGNGTDSGDGCTYNYDNSCSYTPSSGGSCDGQNLGYVTCSTGECVPTQADCPGSSPQPTSCSYDCSQLGDGYSGSGNGTDYGDGNGCQYSYDNSCSYNPPAPACTPDCGNTDDHCSGDTYSDGCGGACQGTKDCTTGNTCVPDCSQVDTSSTCPDQYVADNCGDPNYCQGTSTDPSCGGGSSSPSSPSPSSCSYDCSQLGSGYSGSGNGTDSGDGNGCQYNNDNSCQYTAPPQACTPKSCDDFSSDEANTCSSGDNSTLFEPDGCGGTLTCQGTMDCSSPTPQTSTSEQAAAANNSGDNEATLQSNRQAYAIGQPTCDPNGYCTDPTTGNPYCLYGGDVNNDCSISSGGSCDGQNLGYVTCSTGECVPTQADCPSPSSQASSLASSANTCPDGSAPDSSGNCTTAQPSSSLETPAPRIPTGLPSVGAGGGSCDGQNLGYVTCQPGGECVPTQADCPALSESPSPSSSPNCDEDGSCGLDGNSPSLSPSPTSEDQKFQAQKDAEQQKIDQINANRQAAIQKSEDSGTHQSFFSWVGSGFSNLGSAINEKISNPDTIEIDTTNPDTIAQIRTNLNLPDDTPPDQVLAKYNEFTSGLGLISTVDERSGGLVLTATDAAGGCTSQDCANQQAQNLLQGAKDLGTGLGQKVVDSSYLATIVNLYNGQALTRSDITRTIAPGPAGILIGPIVDMVADKVDANNFQSQNQPKLDQLMQDSGVTSRVDPNSDEVIRAYLTTKYANTQHTVTQQDIDDFKAGGDVELSPSAQDFKQYLLKTDLTNNQSSLSPDQVKADNDALNISKQINDKNYSADAGLIVGTFTTVIPTAEGVGALGKFLAKSAIEGAVSQGAAGAALSVAVSTEDKSAVAGVVGNVVDGLESKAGVTADSAAGAAQSVGTDLAPNVVVSPEDGGGISQITHAVQQPDGSVMVGVTDGTNKTIYTVGTDGSVTPYAQMDSGGVITPNPQVTVSPELNDGLQQTASQIRGGAQPAGVTVTEVKTEAQAQAAVKALETSPEPLDITPPESAPATPPPPSGPIQGVLEDVKSEIDAILPAQPHIPEIGVGSKAEPLPMIRVEVPDPATAIPKDAPSDLPQIINPDSNVVVVPPDDTSPVAQVQKVIDDVKTLNSGTPAVTEIPDSVDNCAAFQFNLIEPAYAAGFCNHFKVSKKDSGSTPPDSGLTPGDTVLNVVNANQTKGGTTSVLDHYPLTVIKDNDKHYQWVTKVGDSWKPVYIGGFGDVLAVEKTPLAGPEQKLLDAKFGSDGTRGAKIVDISQTDPAAFAENLKSIDPVVPSDIGKPQPVPKEVEELHVAQVHEPCTSFEFSIIPKAYAANCLTGLGGGDQGLLSRIGQAKDDLLSRINPFKPSEVEPVAIEGSAVTPAQAEGLLPTISDDTVQAITLPKGSDGFSDKTLLGNQIGKGNLGRVYQDPSDPNIANKVFGGIHGNNDTAAREANKLIASQNAGLDLFPKYYAPIYESDADGVIRMTGYRMEKVEGNTIGNVYFGKLTDNGKITDAEFQALKDKLETYYQKTGQVHGDLGQFLDGKQVAGNPGNIMVITNEDGTKELKLIDPSGYSKNLKPGQLAEYHKLELQSIDNLEYDYKQEFPQYYKDETPLGQGDQVSSKNSQPTFQDSSSLVPSVVSSVVGDTGNSVAGTALDLFGQTPLGSEVLQRVEENPLVVKVEDALGQKTSQSAGVASRQGSVLDHMVVKVDPGTPVNILNPDGGSKLDGFDLILSPVRTDGKGVVETVQPSQVIGIPKGAQVGDPGHITVEQARKLMESGQFNFDDTSGWFGYKLPDGRVMVSGGSHRTTAAVLENKPFKMSVYNSYDNLLSIKTGQRATIESRIQSGALNGRILDPSEYPKGIDPAFYPDGIVQINDPSTMDVSQLFMYPSTVQNAALDASDSLRQDLENQIVEGAKTSNVPILEGQVKAALVYQKGYTEAEADQAIARIKSRLGITQNSPDTDLAAGAHPQSAGSPLVSTALDLIGQTPLGSEVLQKVEDSPIGSLLSGANAEKASSDQVLSTFEQSLSQVSNGSIDTSKLQFKWVNSDYSGPWLIVSDSSGDAVFSAETASFHNSPPTIELVDLTSGITPSLFKAWEDTLIKEGYQIAGIDAYQFSPEGLKFYSDMGYHQLGNTQYWIKGLNEAGKESIAQAEAALKSDNFSRDELLQFLSKLDIQSADATRITSVPAIQSVDAAGALSSLESGVGGPVGSILSVGTDLVDSPAGAGIAQKVDEGPAGGVLSKIGFKSVPPERALVPVPTTALGPALPPEIIINLGSTVEQNSKALVVGAQSQGGKLSTLQKLLLGSGVLGVGGVALAVAQSHFSQPSSPQPSPAAGAAAAVLVPATSIQTTQAITAVKQQLEANGGTITSSQLNKIASSAESYPPSKVTTNQNKVVATTNGKGRVVIPIKSGQQVKVSVASIPGTKVTIPDVITPTCGQTIPITLSAGNGQVQKIKTGAKVTPANSSSGKSCTATVQTIADKNGNGKADPGEKPAPYAGVKVTVSPVVSSKTLTLGVGWDLVSLPGQPQTPLTAGSLLSGIAQQGGYATTVSTLEDGVWQSYIIRGDKSYSGSDFSVAPGKAYFVKMIKPVKYTFSGQDFDSPVQLSLSSGWNAIGVPATSKVYNAATFIDTINTGPANTDSLDRWDSGVWDSYLESGGQGYGDNFNLEETRGYLIRAKGDEEFSP